MKHIWLGVVAIFNWGLATYCAYAFFSFSSRVTVASAAKPDVFVPMEGGGAHGDNSRYVYCAVLALFLQALLAVFNLSVTSYIEHDLAASNRFCILMAATSFLLMMAVFSLLIGHKS